MLLLCGLTSCGIPENRKQDKPLDANLLFAIVQDGKFGFINRTGELVIEPKFRADKFKRQMFSPVIGMAEFEELVGSPNWYGEPFSRSEFPIIPEYIFPRFSEGLAPVMVDDKTGFIDKTGKLVIEAKFESALSFSEGLATVVVGGKAGFINKSGQMVIEPQFPQAFSFNEGLARVLVDLEWCYINKAGNIVITQPITSPAPPPKFSEGLSPVKIGDKIGFMDTKGKTVIEPQFESACFFSEGLAAVEVDNKWGYIDKSGRMVIQPKFDEACEFSDGFAVAYLSDEYSMDDQGGYINKKGKMVIKPQFNGAGYFRDGLARVRVGDKWGYIDKTGKYIWEPTE
jgi:hypothetical protein